MFNNRSLSDIQAAFRAKDQNTNSNYYPFYKIQVGSQAVVRFLPDTNPDNPMGFLVEKVVHNLTINGNYRTVTCLSMFDEDCPICKVSQKYYQAGDKTNGKKYWKNKLHLGQVLVISDPLPPDPETQETHEGKIRYISLKYQLFEIIKSAFEGGDLDEIPFAYKNGYNFIIKKQQQGDYATYALGSDFARKPTSLTDEQIAYAEEHMVDLSTLLPQHPGLENVEAQLNAALTGANYSDGHGDNVDDNDYVPPATQDDSPPSDAQASAPLPGNLGDRTLESQASHASAPPPAEMQEQDGDDILAKIRQKRRKAAAE
jgi:hypothetical protein